MVSGAKCGIEIHSANSEAMFLHVFVMSVMQMARCVNRVNNCMTPWMLSPNAVVRSCWVAELQIPLQDAVLKNDFGMDSIAWGFVDSPSLGHRHQGRSDVVEIFMRSSAHGIRDVSFVMVPSLKAGTLWLAFS